MARLQAHAQGRAVAVLLAVLAVAPQSCRAALNVETHATEGLVRRLRRAIFVETAYLEERREECCSSLDGPVCLAALLTGGRGRGAVSGALGDIGVISDRLLHDLGVANGGVGFVTPEYDVLEAYRRRFEELSSLQASPMLTADEAHSRLRDARSGAERGTLHFADLRLDSRVPLTFSRDLPHGTVATWDGRWLVRDCGTSAGGATIRLALPAPDDAAEDPFGPAVPLAPRAVALAGTGSTVSAVAQLVGSVGYLRFSKPVVVRSLFARWQPPAGAPPAVVGGRLGLQGMWTTHLDPAKLRGVHGWLDISGGSLQPVDEVAFIATQGIEVGALEVVAHAADGGEDEHRAVLLLAPVAGAIEPSVDEEQPAKPRFTLRMERLNGAAAPFIVSLQEAIDRNLRLRATPLPRAAGQPRGAYVPGLLSTGSPPLLPDQTNLTWVAVATTNQAIFEHKALGQLFAAAAPGALAALDDPDGQLPADLRKQLPAERAAILEALLGWYSGGGGGWRRSTPSSLPRNGTDEALLRYVTAKRWQTKLDLLTAMLLHQRPHNEPDLAASGAARSTE